MILDKGVEAIDGLPVLYIKSISALVCSDLHLGYEGAMADNGAFLPKVNLNHIKKIIKQAADLVDADKIIIDGDIKNTFSKVSLDEMNEFRELIQFLTGELKLKKVIIVKGNHDNFINRVSNMPNVEIHEEEVVIGDFLFFHGENLPKGSAEFMVMGHVHPAISLGQIIDANEKLKCFLYGKTKKNGKLIVLPAISYFASGLSINLDTSDSVAPIFKSIADINKMHAMCIGNDETLDFGSVGELRNASRRGR